MISNKHIILFVAGLLILGFSFQFNSDIQPDLLGKIEKESKLSDSEVFKVNEQVELAYLQDNIIEAIQLGFSDLDYNLDYLTSANCFYSSIISRKICNHSPPTSV